MKKSVSRSGEMLGCVSPKGVLIVGPRLVGGSHRSNAVSRVDTHKSLRPNEPGLSREEKELESVETNRWALVAPRAGQVRDEHSLTEGAISLLFAHVDIRIGERRDRGPKNSSGGPAIFVREITGTNLRREAN